MVTQASPDCPLPMRNTIQEYAWGSRTAIAELTGAPVPSPRPQAELWMGDHPKAPSRVWFRDQWHSLDRLIRQHPEAVLGEAVVRRFGPQLPFLFKILAAGQPLSIQAHPDRRQAEGGFRRENEAGINLDAPNRNYRDPNHKPECLCALTEFTGLYGFRSPDRMTPLMEAVWPAKRRDLLDLLTGGGIEPFFASTMRLPDEERFELVARCAANAQSAAGDNPAFFWVCRLNALYPGDIGVLGPLILNVTSLQPGEAIYLGARQLHAYLDGLGIEIMANSDNVLRGGLTPKHVDVPELIRVLDFGAQEPHILHPEPTGGHAYAYFTPAEEFELSIIRLDGKEVETVRCDSVSILLCTAGEAGVDWRPGSGTVRIRKGDSLLLPAALNTVSITGSATIYRATVNSRTLYV
jgi:mannose-6-phosphate isomerase